jgi:hypothetical protein
MFDDSTEAAMQIQWNDAKKNAFVGKTCGLPTLDQCGALKCTQDADGITFEIDGKSQKVDLPFEIVGKVINGTIGNQAIKAVTKSVKPVIESLIATEAEVVDLSKVVSLFDASEIFQPVKGTSASSIYRVIALRNDLKVAARYINNTVSIRIEGDIKNYFEKLKQASMSVHAGKGYASMHLGGIETPVMMRKVVASILGAMEIEFDRTLTKLSKLQGEGQ